MILGKEIVNLVELLEVRNTSLYHACQFTDFQAYLRLGGIPSRAYLEQNREYFTPFETDSIDHENDVWDKVFVNLADFGEIFANGRCGVPNPFGPIVFQIRPSALLEATDVAVCLRSAGASGFDRQQEALGSTAEIDNLFLNPLDSGYPESTFVRFGEQLRQVYLQAINPEVSCSVERGYLPLSDIVVAWIDPYVIGGRPLISWVEAAMIERGVVFPLWQRNCRADRHLLYGEVLAILYPPSKSLHDIANSRSASLCLKSWAEELLERDLAYQYRRYASYLNGGTVQPLLNTEADGEGEVAQTDYAK